MKYSVIPILFVRNHVGFQLKIKNMNKFSNARINVILGKTLSMKLSKKRSLTKPIKSAKKKMYSIALIGTKAALLQ